MQLSSVTLLRKKFLSEQRTHFIRGMALFSDKRPFVSAKIPVLPQTDVYLALFHVPAPIVLLNSHKCLCICSLLLLLCFPMTRLSEEAVVPCFQLTLRRISEPKSAWLSRRSLLRLSAALASSLPCVWFKR